MRLFRYSKLDIDRFAWHVLLLFVFTIPLSQPLSIKLLIITLLLSCFLNKRKNFFKQYLFRSWDAILYMTILLIGLLYSKELRPGFQAVETSLSLVALPLIFISIKKFNLKKIYSIVSFFCIGLFVSALICLVHAVWAYVNTNDWRVFFFYDLTNVIGFQPTYYAYYMIFGITCCMHAFYHGLIEKNRWFLACLSLFFFLILLLTGGWTAMVSLFFVFSFFILKYLLDKKTLSRSIVVVLIIVMLGGLFVLHTVVDPVVKKNIGNDYWERSMLWKAAISINSNPIFGVGTGDTNYVLNRYYHDNGMEQFAINNYNAHNQFVHTYFAQGIVGLVALFLLLGRLLYLAAIKRRAIVVLVFFPFVVYGITEAFLGRYQGVVFFALLHQIFLSYLYINHSTLLKSAR